MFTPVESLLFLEAIYAFQPNGLSGGFACFALDVFGAKQVSMFSNQLFLGGAVPFEIAKRHDGGRWVVVNNPLCRLLGLSTDDVDSSLQACDKRAKTFDSSNKGTKYSCSWKACVDFFPLPFDVDNCLGP